MECGALSGFDFIEVFRGVPEAFFEGLPVKGVFVFLEGKMGWMRGFEPPTPGATVQCSDR